MNALRQDMHGGDDAQGAVEPPPLDHRIEVAPDEHMWLPSRDRCLRHDEHVAGGVMYAS